MQKKILKRYSNTYFFLIKGENKRGKIKKKRMKEKMKRGYRVDEREGNRKKRK